MGFASNWSERHAAYACGLGAFGLSDGLITAKGKAMRVGSVVTDLPLKPSEKIYPHHRANCLYYFNKTCKACAPVVRRERLQQRAMTKINASNTLYEMIRPDKKEEYGVKITGCGLCQTEVPCEFEIPKLIQKQYLNK